MFRNRFRKTIEFVFIKKMKLEKGIRGDLSWLSEKARVKYWRSEGRRGGRNERENETLEKFYNLISGLVYVFMKLSSVSGLKFLIKVLFYGRARTWERFGAFSSSFSKIGDQFELSFKSPPF